jgi:hypothetical protein
VVGSIGYFLRVGWLSGAVGAINGRSPEAIVAKGVKPDWISGI